MVLGPFEYYQLTSFEDYADSNPGIDLILCCSSPEDRSSRLAQLLPSGPAEEAVVFHFTDPYGYEEREYNLRRIKTLLEHKGWNAQTYACSFRESEIGLREFDNRFNQLLRHCRLPLLDMTTFTKPYLFGILRLLRDVYSLPYVDVAYTEPASYPRGSAREAVFTEDVTWVAPMPGFFGSYHPERERLLVVLLGFEGARSTQVHQRIAPDITLAVNGFPAYMPGWEDRSIMANEDFLKQSGAASLGVYTAPAYDPFETVNQLQEISRDLGIGRYNISLAPLGPKPQALGGVMFALYDKEVQLVFPFPSKYRQKASLGSGKTWVYHIPLFFESVAVPGG